MGSPAIRGAGKVEAVCGGFGIESVEEFEEGGLPRKLFLVTPKKPN